MQTSSATIPQIIAARLVRDRSAVDVALVIGASCLIAIAAQIAIPVPLSPVPMTMQPVAVLLVAATLGSKRGAAAAALYLVEGFSGLPVFAPGSTAAWFGPTFGYLIAYPAAAFLTGWLSERGWMRTLLGSIAAMLLALGIIYLGGWSWLAQLTSPRVALLTGIAPFVVVDVVKITLASMVLPFAQRVVTRTED